MPQTQAVGVPPPGGPRPPAPPASGEPGRGPDPADPGPPITVHVGGMMLGDLGHPRVDAKILTAILMRNSSVGDWLRARGVSLEDLDPPPVVRRPDRPRAPSARYATAEEIAIKERQDTQKSQAMHRLVADAGPPDYRQMAVHLNDLPLGDLGNSQADSRLVNAIVLRGGAITDWLSNRVGDVTNVEQSFPGSSWT
jgi:hypothetical protein